MRALALAAVGPARSRLPVLDGLRLARAVVDQAGLGADDRARNLCGAVRVRDRLVSRLQGRPCVLVDDVVTTGATLQECARALRAAGCGPVVAVTLAATRRHTRSVGPDGPTASTDSHAAPLQNVRGAD
ncbi:ComF family protein [Ornithinimicrobium avium]|uniref:ComF family protein n=1 Tax=Ornithinimicrobium avium TaxID=2283195 RepID=A0A345NLB8_9MICO|nr:ComF family protein [Ornithinimicrobium avium]